MKTYAVLYCTLLYTCRTKSEVITDEDNDNRGKNDGKYSLNTDKLHRRFLEDVNDEDWHLSHLKDVDFWSTRRSCEGDTFDDKVRQYKRMLRNDGALVDFVSADTLPFNETDLKEDDKICNVKEIDLNNVANGSNITNSDDKSNLQSNRNLKMDVIRKIHEHDKNRSVNEQVDQATTVESNPILLQTNDVVNKSVEEKNRRASEYMFSSAEYYDEVVDFDESSCPSAVEVIVLELDQLRSYDVECESIIEWRSLE